MSIWQHAEEMLLAIKSDLDEHPPRWENAAQKIDGLKILVPDYPKFQQHEAGTSLQMTDWDIGQVRADLTHLELGLTTQDLKLALKSTLSALENVQALGRRGAP
jgi:hypothetical protein